MAKIYGAEKIRRTCMVRGREDQGRFSLVRKQMNISKILAPGTEGEGEDVSTELIYDEWITPRPPRVPAKGPAEAKVHAADRPLRRVCFVEGRDPNQKYHLLQKRAELSKVLAVGTEGTGEWIGTGLIRHEHMVPVPTKARVVERKPVRVCKLVDTGDQEYMILRKVEGKGAKLLPVYEGNYGITVTDLTRIVGEQVINQAKKGGRRGRRSAAADTQSENGEQVATETVASSAPAAPAHVTPPAPAAPVAHTPPAASAAPVNPAAPAAPVQRAPAPQAPVAAQPPRPASPQPQRPVPMQPGAPRPQPVAAGVAPRAPVAARPSAR